MFTTIQQDEVSNELLELAQQLYENTTPNSVNEVADDNIFEAIQLLIKTRGYGYDDSAPPVPEKIYA